MHEYFRRVLASFKFQIHILDYQHFVALQYCPKIIVPFGMQVLALKPFPFSDE